MSRTAWLLSFSDLTAVLAGFMVLIIAMSDFGVRDALPFMQNLGKAEGDWQQATSATAPGAEDHRVASERHATARYLTSIIAAKLRDTGWPWQVRRDGATVALEARNGTADVPSAMLAWLIGAGYETAIEARIPASSSVSRGAIDRAAGQAGQLARRLDGSRALPVAIRFDAGRAETRLRIVLNPRKGDPL